MGNKVLEDIKGMTTEEMSDKLLREMIVKLKLWVMAYRPLETAETIEFTKKLTKFIKDERA